ncbi:MAG: hypothetical protein WBF42_05835 [Terracidiphilus sp.]
MDEKRELLRHTLATVAYRAVRALEGTPDSFARFSGTGGRQPAQLLAHMADLFDWALSIAQGRQQWHNSEALPWPAAQEHFFASLKALDDYLASAEPVHGSLERLFQGPIADALTHVGQMAMMRRLAGAPGRGENIHAADIAVGRVGADQAEPVQPF